MRSHLLWSEKSEFIPGKNDAKTEILMIVHVGLYIPVHVNRYTNVCNTYVIYESLLYFKFGPTAYDRNSQVIAGQDIQT